MAEYKNFQDYLLTQKEAIEDSIDEVINAPDDKIKFGPDGVLNKFEHALALYLSPDISERRYQLITLGVNPKMILSIDLNGAQTYVSMRVINTLKRHDGVDSVRTLASALKNNFVVG